MLPRAPTRPRTSGTDHLIGIGLVIHAGPPHSAEALIHRNGRAGRGGGPGLAVLVAATFPGIRTIAVVVAYSIASLLVSLPYLAWRRRMSAAG